MHVMIMSWQLLQQAAKVLFTTLPKRYNSTTEELNFIVKVVDMQLQQSLHAIARNAILILRDVMWNIILDLA
jgi:hypothetical protein